MSFSNINEAIAGINTVSGQYARGEYSSQNRVSPFCNFSIIKKQQGSLKRQIAGETVSDKKQAANFQFAKTDGWESVALSNINLLIFEL